MVHDLRQQIWTESANGDERHNDRKIVSSTPWEKLWMQYMWILMEVDQIWYVRNLIWFVHTDLERNQIWVTSLLDKCVHRRTYSKSQVPTVMSALNGSCHGLCLRLNSRKSESSSHCPNHTLQQKQLWTWTSPLSDPQTPQTCAALSCAPKGLQLVTFTASQINLSPHNLMWFYCWSVFIWLYFPYFTDPWVDAFWKSEPQLRNRPRIYSWAVECPMERLTFKRHINYLVDSLISYWRKIIIKVFYIYKYLRLLLVH